LCPLGEKCCASHPPGPCGHCMNGTVCPP
jgi:hypothetical protein